MANKKESVLPDYLFEVSWEVCNKVGGIHTVISTKALTLAAEWEDRLIMIGPDLWRSTEPHPEFEEDKDLYKTWRVHAEKEGLKVKIGRWKIMGNPVVVLVDFTNMFPQKNEILKELWLNYKVDSISGGWDYIEPVLFGYAAGKVIECFYNHYLSFSDKIVAQFHEWLSGSGLLYTETHVPQVGTIFTTHATVVGRAIAGNNMPFYSKFDKYNADQEARQFNLVAKHSMEKTAAQHADCFTTVSEITARECTRFLGKTPDLITPNGFDDTFVPDPFYYKQMRTAAREKLFAVAEALLGKTLSKDTLFILKAGRYEFRNKGIDIFINALGHLRQEKTLKKDIVAFIFIPAHQTGPRKVLLDALQGKSEVPQGERVLTHNLQGANYDPIMREIRSCELQNGKEDHVNVIFAPVYLDGKDGIFNKTYYELLTAFDLTVFPSYYEPWGYTPLESLAFHIPTITTDVAGFGMLLKESNEGAYILDRKDDNDEKLTETIANIIADFSGKSEDEIKKVREVARELSKKATWKHLIGKYKEAYEMALQKTTTREDQFVHHLKVEEVEAASPALALMGEQPVWRKIFVKSTFPQKLSKLQDLARNLWWTWNNQAADLFRAMSPDLWEEVEHNPIEAIDSLPYEQSKALESNENFLQRLNNTYTDFEQYMQKRKKPKGPLIAYFCMEYGFHQSVKLYSGGLGILAGDYLKEASDMAVNMVGIGLLYRNGYFKQDISINGEQLSLEDHQKFTMLPLQPIRNADDEWMKITIPFPGRTLYAKAWKLDVGSIPLYLLDTDIPENNSEDRQLTSQLYGGNNEHRLKQEILLGIGGVRLLQLVGIEPEVYHCNEGHAAFAGIERLQRLIVDQNLSFDEAVEVVRASSLFTTHTPVEAGHDAFTEDMLRVYLSQYPATFNISWDRFVKLGTIADGQANYFSMSYLATRLSQEVNGVSEIHGKVTRDMFKKLWPAYRPEELHISHVTNGVHVPTWLAEEWHPIFKDNRPFTDVKNEPELWQKVSQAPDEQVWNTHISLKNKLIHFLTHREQDKLYNSPTSNHSKLTSALTANTFMVGFARRFALYKRANMLFNNLNRLAAIVNDPQKPVIFLFSGKAHPHDMGGQQLIRRIIEVSRMPEFEGKILFIENYNMEVAGHLVQGVDLWLNTPVPGMEASGTSGMKANMNGVINFSVLDGWWAEAYHPESGWAVPLATEPYSSNEEEAQEIYDILQKDIIPLYFDRDEHGIPKKWVGKMKNAMSEVAPRFTTGRMLQEYIDKYYQPLSERAMEVEKNEFALAKQMAGWKSKIKKSWNSIRIIDMDIYDSANKPFPFGEDLKAQIIVGLNGLSPDDVGVEIVFATKSMGEDHIIMRKDLDVSKDELGNIKYECSIPMTFSGVHEYSFRIFPKNQLLPHRQDFDLARWI